MLYSLQHNGNDDIAYDMDQESFILEFHKLPQQSYIHELSQDMLRETRRIEKNLVSKLNCMYFAARKVSVPSIDYMMRKEKEMGEEAANMYIGFSKKLNTLINSYFMAGKGCKYKVKLIHFFYRGYRVTNSR